MTNEEKAKVEEALEDVWEGQCWTIKEGRDEDPGCPKALVIVQKRSFLFGNILTIATEPVEKLGHPFSIRADVLVDCYVMVYDHATHLGRIEGEVFYLREALQAVVDNEADKMEVLKGLAVEALRQASK